MSKGRIPDHIQHAVNEIAQSRLASMEISGIGLPYVKFRRPVETILNEMVDRGRQEDVSQTGPNRKNTRKRRRGPKIVVYQFDG